MSGHKYTNKLIEEKSPYLLQHAHNPVEWYPWGDEAFNRARDENKPIFLSIGYSTCHWCHVMAHESFEDEEVASLMNKEFISIKVDREERPDIDSIYMTVCQMMTGSGGWPLTIIMTPDKKPFYAGTYIPKHSRFGRLGMMELIPRLKELWNENHDEVINSAEGIIKAIHESEEDTKGGRIDQLVLDKAYRQFAKTFDPKNGGFGSAPKFPTPHNLMFLLRYWRRTKEPHALEMVTKTLDVMSLGGIYDQVGYGFHRYSTDARWLLPHFEKMLYDQAMLLMAYTEAYQATHNDRYRAVANQIFTYLTRDMLSDEGAFYSAEDADSEGEEGKFYIWTIKDLEEILSEEDVKLACEVYNIYNEGNFKDESSGKKIGANILHLKKSIEELKPDTGLENFEARLENIRMTLFIKREERERPHRDDKILTDWNGLIIAALSKASAAFDDNKFSDAAVKAADFILSSIDKNNGLKHRYRKGDWSVEGNVDDYSFLIWGLIELYEATFGTKYLKKAFELTDTLLKKFWDSEKGGFFFTSEDAEKLFIRNKEVYDGAIPSGNSVSLLNLLKLARISGNFELEESAKELEQAFSRTVSDIPYAHSQFLAGCDFAIGPSFEVVIAGKLGSEDTRKMIEKLRSNFIPNKVVILNPAGDEKKEIYDLSDYVEHQGMIGNRATAYVCRDFVCSKPTDNIEEMFSHFKH